MPRTKISEFVPRLLLSAWVLCTPLAILAKAPAAGKKAKPVAPAKQPSATKAEKGRPIPADSNDAIGDNPQGHHDWRWHLLTYPGTSIPPHPFTTAREWVKANVPDAPRWQNAAEGLPRPELDAFGRAVTPVDDGSWTFLGPRPIQTNGYGKITGRFNAMAVDPRTANNEGQVKAFAGAASGGLWVTTNCCGANTTWTSVLDDEQLVTQAIGAITFDPTNPDVIYVGTGDFNAADQFGEGILKSTDGGATWTQYAADVFTPGAAGTPHYLNQNTGVIAVDPNNPSTLLAGARFGLFLSRDAGVTWSFLAFGANLQDPLKPVDDPANYGKGINRISSIYMDPTTNPTTVYVGVGYTSATYAQNNGIYKGTLPVAGLPAFTKVSTYAGGGKVRLAASRGNATSSLTLYAQVHNLANSAALGTYVTRDGGATWKLLTGSALSDQTQDWYDLFALADPGDDRTLYIGRADLYKYAVDASYSSITRVSMGGYSGQGLHPDQQWGCWVSGTGDTAQFLTGNDGGLYLTKRTGANTWNHTSLSETINATQWYSGQIGRNFAQVGGPSLQLLFGGSQDNGTSSWDSGQATPTWQFRQGGDGMQCAFDPYGSVQTEYWFGEYYNGQTYRSTTGADGPYSMHTIAPASDRRAWSSPLRLDPYHCTDLNCRNLLFASQYLYATGTGGDGGQFNSGWKKCSGDLTKGTGSIIALNQAPSDPKGAIVGTDDGNVQVTVNLYNNATGMSCTQADANTDTFGCTGNTAAVWTNLTQSNAVLPNRAILGVAFDPLTTNKVYAAVGGFNSNTPTTPGHLFQCTKSGSTWTWLNKTGNLPDVPAESVLVNPSNPKQVFLGTDFGFFYTENIDAQPPLWYRYNYGLPTTVIAYLNMDRGPSTAPYASTTLAAFTYGRGTYAIRVPGSAGFPPHPVPPTMKASRNGTAVDLQFEVTQCGNPTHNLYWGTLGNYSAVTGGTCGLGNTGSASASLPDNAWFVLTGATAGGAPGALISSFGTDSQGQQESFTGWQTVTGCANYSQQNTVTTCP